MAVDGEVIVETGDPGDAEPLHDGEARPIDDGEILVGEGCADRPGGFEVGGGDMFYARRSPPDAIPKALRRMVVIAAVQEEPGFDHHVIRRHVTARVPQ